MSKLTVYKASAGSGKTFTLAVSYIKLLIKDPQAYKNILAVTFTNKATAEMKSRILEQLYGIWKGDPSSESYLNKLITDTGFTESFIREQAEKALLLMLHDYSRFRVETIDSFFQSILRNLARELDLNPNLNIELNGREVLSEAVDSFIEKLEPESMLLKWLIDYIEEKISDNKRWDVSQEIKDFSVNILDENYIEKGKGLRAKLRDSKLIPAYRKSLRELETAALEEMQSFYKRFHEILTQQAISTKDLKYGNRIESYFNKLNQGNLLNEVRNASVEKYLSDPEEWVKKSSNKADLVLSIASQSLIPLLEEAEEARQKNNAVVNSCSLSLKHLNKLQLLAHIDDEMRTLNKESNRFLLSDTNALLRDLIKEGDSSFVFEKIGSSILNIMIDEFQDTSRMQWQNFQLLLTEGLSQGGDSLIVGDIKQSIYRWRNGDWSILNDLGKGGHFMGFDLIQKPLQTNWRSESNIIYFNNAIFPTLVEELNKQYQEDFNEPCEALLQAYEDVEQHSSKKENKGYAQIEFIAQDSAATYLEDTLVSLASNIQHLIREVGVKPNDIAILVRKKKNIPAIANYLTQELGLTVVSDEAFRLDASVALNLLIEALRYLSTPDDLIIEANLALSYQQEIKANPLSSDELLLHEDRKSLLPDPFLAEMDLLRELPLYELLEKLFVYFELDQLERQDAYLFSFFDKLIQYLETESSLLEEFITYWDETLSAETIPSGEIDGIRILTIHKSKGLEFHTVLIPFCDWPIETDRYDELLWCSPPPVDPFNQLDIIPINYGTKMAESYYYREYAHERLQLWVDNLNLLYVALTRAGSNLFLFCKAQDKRSISGLIEGCLSLIAQRLKIDWEVDSPFQFGSLCASQQKSEKTSTNVFLAPPQGTQVTMQSLPHDFRFKQSNRSRDFISGVEEDESPTRFISKGKLLHELFAQIKTIQDLEPAIKRLQFEGLIGSTEEEENIRSIASQAFANPQVQEWYSDQWELFTECEIIFTHEQQMESRRPDRVMIQGKKAIVVDFKFGRKYKTHLSQVKEYMKLLTRMGYAPVEGFLWYVNLDQIQPVK